MGTPATSPAGSPDWVPDWVWPQLDAVIPVYRRSRPPGWPDAVAGAGRAAAFLSAFRPHLPQDDAAPLLTGYFEPELDARLQPDPVFAHPIYRLPEDPGHSHAAIAAGVLAGQGLEIAWLADPVDVFFLQVQGSGRLRLPDGTLRVGFGGKNGHPYRSLGREMVARGLISAADISADAIRAWLSAHPGRVRELLLSNPSYVYFREMPDLGPHDGPVGTAGVPLTALRSLAVDPDHVPLGALVLMETRIGGADVCRLMVAQDTGGVIKGAQRADIYFGSGDAAGLAAGRQNAPGRLTVLLPQGG